jgi:Helix-turn-helix domain
MSFMYEDRLSGSPLVRTIWRTQSESNGTYTAVADGSWDLLVIRQEGEVRVCIAGPATKAAPIVYKQGMEYLGIRFAIGAFMPHLPQRHILDDLVTLPKATSDSFWLDDSALRVPEYHNVEAFVERLVRGRLLARDAAVHEVVQGDTQALSVRSMQRRFRHATGLTPGSIQQIERARHAADLLGQGITILDAVDHAGYADQPHMTRALKRYVGQTPAQIARMAKP